MRQFMYTVSCVLMLASTVLFAQAPNDECSTATVIAALPFNTTQNTRLATVNVADPTMNGTCNDSAAVGKSVWFKYTADANRTVYFSTIGSTPAADFDIMMGVYTGTCGALTEIACSDDAQSTRQSELFIDAKSGTTYYVLVGEWHGGGTSGGVPTGGDLVFKAYEGAPPLPPTIVKGPKFGTSPVGVTVTTDNFSAAPEASDAPSFDSQVIVPYNDVPPIPDLSEIAPGKYPSKSESRQRLNSLQQSSASSGVASKTIIVNSYQAFPMQASIPPDPIMAVGPNHVITMVNTSFRIFEKNGKLLKSIPAQNFFGTIAPGTGPNDPQIIYDHYANRWVMLWMTSPTATDHRHLFAVSDDSNPLGSWYQWSTSAISVGDSLTPNWGDYPSLAYDSVALYLGSHQFPLAGGSFAYGKVRIVPKAQLYTNSTAAVKYTDFWDFRDTVKNAPYFGLRPVNGLTKSDKAFFVSASRFTPSSYLALYTIANPTSNTPTVTSDSIHVMEHRSAPAPQQLGGSTTALEGSGFQIRANGIFRDSSIYITHSVASGPNNEFSSLHIVKFNPLTKKVSEDVLFGADGFYHFYSAIAVNKNQDVMVTYSRSGLTEYIGAYMSGRKKDDPAGTFSTATMQAGAGNYVVVGGGRNRWGDYSGAALDPTDQTTIWAHTEYASAQNKYATWISAAKMGPLPGGFFVAEQSYFDFGLKEANKVSGNLPLKISNAGLDSLTISNITLTSDQFGFANKPAFPYKIASDASFNLQIFFKPTSKGIKNDTITITTNDPSNLTYKAIVTGSAFEIVKAVPGTMYSSSGSVDGGKLYTINTSNGVPSEVGKLAAAQMNSLRVHPTTKELIGYNSVGSTGGGAFFRISKDGLSIEQISITNTQNLKGLAFYNDSMAYTGAFGGAIYTVNIKTGVLTQIGSNSGLRAGGLAINPVNGTLWMSLRNAGTGGITDNIYKLNRSTGLATLVGKTNIGIGTNDIVFDKNGKLYGLSGTATTNNKLIVIDTTTGAGAVIGDLGKADIQAIALDPDAVVSVGQQIAGVLPTVYSLDQNFPNPFNPSTTIRFSIPNQSNVVLTVYDVVGREVARLVEGVRQPGVYSVQFDASSISSGVYYYKLNAGSYSSIKKMLILK